MAVDIERTAFSAKIFGIFDSDGSHKIDFAEFVLSLWQFCSLSDSDLCNFAFRCFAKKRNKRWELDNGDCQVLLNAIYGTDCVSKERRLTQQYLEHTIRRDGALTVEHWIEWTKHNARALFPIFVIQRQMRRRCLGSRFWRTQQKRRKRLFGKHSWEEIELRLEEAGIACKRRVITFDEREPLPFSDADLEVTPREVKGGDDVAQASSYLRMRPCMPIGDDTQGRARSLQNRIASCTPKYLPVRKSARKKPRNLKYRVVDIHGYEQAVATCEHSPKTSPKSPPGPTDPIKVKVKRFVQAKRTRVEAIAILNRLRKGPKLIDSKQSSTAKSSPVHAQIETVVANSQGAARYVARAIAQRKLKESPPLAPYRVLTEPSNLEKGSGMQYLGHFVPLESTT